jgi:hypothetical protein
MILNGYRLNTKFIERVEYNHFMWASGEHNIVLFNEFKKFNLEQHEYDIRFYDIFKLRTDNSLKEPISIEASLVKRQHWRYVCTRIDQKVTGPMYFR